MTFYNNGATPLFEETVTTVAPRARSRSRRLTFKEKCVIKDAMALVLRPSETKPGHFKYVDGINDKSMARAHNTTAATIISIRNEVFGQLETRVVESNPNGPLSERVAALEIALADLKRKLGE